MKVSVVICTYSLDTYNDFTEALESVLSQTYEKIEPVVIVDGNEELYEKIQSEYSSVQIRLNEENIGLSRSRNRGVELATGDVIAFLDDDAVADQQWIEELVSVYEEQNAIAVGGKMIGEWVAGNPLFLPAEFYWLVGVTHRGFAESGEEVRNTFGSNISFRKEVFDEIGGFDPELGRRGSLNVQSEETIFCVRMHERYGRGVVYNTEAVVAHKVFDYRTDPKWLLERAFWQGYSKWVLSQMVNEELGENEATYLKQLVFGSVPRRIHDVFVSRSSRELKQLVAIFAFTTAVGLGYLYGTWTSIRNRTI